MWKIVNLVLLLPFLAQSELVVARCNYYEHPLFGYTCEVANLQFKAGDELQVTGTHMLGKNNENVATVEIANSTIEVVPLQYFISFPILTRFYAQNVGISTLNRLRNCASLQHLFLSQNKLDIIRGDTFADCANLQSIHLQNNMISNIERWAFRDATKLEVLLLNNNQLEVINADLFTPTPNLLDLGLSNNRLETLNSRLFTPTLFLETLRLSNNNITILNVNIFQNLTQLSTLLLNGNNFDNFQANFFRNLPSLRLLNVDDNMVSCNERKMFKCEPFKSPIP
jgi:Leucine-rich repeat (LRR) protein